MDSGVRNYYRAWVTCQADLLRIPAVQVAVREGQRLLDEFALGKADIEGAIDATPRTLFRVASQSKTFTAIVVMSLVERGLLRLDHTVGRWIPALSGSRIATATIEQLLTHTAGVTRDGHDGSYWTLDRQFPMEADIVSIARGDGTSESLRGHFKYSNIGFALLGQIISVACGSSYDTIAQQVIVRPLGLTLTGTDIDLDRLPEYATGYSRVDRSGSRSRLRTVRAEGLGPAGGWFSNAAECSSIYSQLLGDSELLSGSPVGDLWSSPVDTGDGETKYGFGLQIEDPNGRLRIGHPGGWVGHASSTIIDVERGSVATVLTNAIDGRAHDLALGFSRLERLAFEAQHAPAGESGHKLCGRYENVWSVWDVVLLGGRLFCINPINADPASTAMPLEQVSDSVLRVASHNGHLPIGEDFTFGPSQMIGPSRMPFARRYDLQLEEA